MCCLFCVVLCIVCMCICVLNNCHRVATQLQLTNTSYHIISYYIISYHIISYHIIYHIIYYITSHHISYHISYNIIYYITHISYIISYIILYHITSYIISYIISHHIISHIISYHIISIDLFLCILVTLHTLSCSGSLLIGIKLDTKEVSFLAWPSFRHRTVCKTAVLTNGAHVVEVHYHGSLLTTTGELLRYLFGRAEQNHATP